MTVLTVKLAATVLASWLFLQSAEAVRHEDPLPAFGWAAASGAVLSVTWQW